MTWIHHEYLAVGATLHRAELMARTAPIERSAYAKTVNIGPMGR
jgi:hypothetical protein